MRAYCVLQYALKFMRKVMLKTRKCDRMTEINKLEICKGGFTMKKIGLGIAILLFAIVISLCSSGMGLLVIGIGIVGLIFSIIGFMECK